MIDEPKRNPSTNMKTQTRITVTGIIMGLILLTNLACQAAEGKAAESAAQKVDWRKMMTIADPKHDAQGNLLPLQSYDETIRRGMSFLLNDHLKWFKGPPEALLDESGQTRMPWVYYSNLQHNGAPFPSSVDRFVSYPAFHHALTIWTFIRYWRYAKDGRALAEAVKLADWNIAHSTPADWAYGSLPYSTFQEKKPGGFRDKTGLMPDKAAIMALAYLQLHEATGEARFLRAAEAVALTLRKRQRPDGTWPFRVDPKTEQVIEEYTSSVIYAVMLFEKLDKLNGNHQYQASRDRAWKWLLSGPVKTKEFRGFYEDIPASPKGRTNYDCLDTIRYLLANRTADNGYLEMAKDLSAWVEKTFADKIKSFEPAEGIREQLQCNVVMGVHSLNWASMLLELSAATGDEKMRQRAIQTANYVTYYLQPDNRIVVGFTYHQWWYSCHTGVILYLLDFVDNKQDSAGLLRLENRHIAAQIDRKTGAVRSIRDKEQGVTYPFSGIGFEVTTEAGCVRSESAAEAKPGKDGVELRFTAGGLEIGLFYSLGPEDRFIEKWLEIRSEDGRPCFLKSVVLEDLNTEAFTEIHFHDDQTIWHCPINLFLRGEKGGCFAGLEYPYWELKQKGKEGFTLGYKPNYQVAKGEVNVSEKYFLGVYRKEGIHRISQGPYPGRGRSLLLHWGNTGLSQQFKDGKIPPEVKDVPTETLDWGEVWAMQAFMRRIQPDDLQLPEDGYWVWQNGWWAGLFDPKPKILDALKAAGIHDIMTAHTWYGRGNHPNLEAYLYKMRIDPLGFPEDAAVAGLAGNNPAAGWHAPQEVKLDAFKVGEFTPDFKAPPAMQKFIDYGKKIGVHVSSFAVPGLLFEARPQWRSLDEQGKPSQYLFGRGVSCPACDDYMKNALALHEAVFSQFQPRWWGWDGRWLSFWEVPQFRSGPLGCGPDPCYAKNHGHSPGDNLYKEWKNIQSFLKAIRQRHPRLCLETYYGLKRGEPWVLRYLNAADNYYETNGADMNRLQAWHNQNDRFRPVYKNYAAIFGDGMPAFQFNVISALSCTAYCQIGPGFKGLAHEANREFLKKWREWATCNYSYLKIKRDLFDCPGDSAIDGSAHIIGDRGFLFLFPGGFDRKVEHAKILRASIPVCRWLGLDEKPAALYRMREIYPREGTDLGVYRYGEEFLYDMPTDSPVILALEPAASGSKPEHPPLGGQQDQVLVVPAFLPAVKAEQGKAEPRRR
jgi:hypothetical protein